MQWIERKKPRTFTIIDNTMKFQYLICILDLYGLSQENVVSMKPNLFCSVPFR